MAGRLVVKITCGAEAPERLAQGLTVATTAVESGVEVTLWLTGDAVWLAVPDARPVVTLEHSAPLGDLVEACVAGGDVVVCTQCAARRDITEAALMDGVRIGGAAEFVGQVLADGTQALVY